MKKYKIPYLISSLLFFFLQSESYSQTKIKTEASAEIVEYTIKDGLPSSNLSTIIQTSDGYIWLSGPEGTFRFDGYEFNFIGEEYGIPEMQAIYYDSLKNVLYFASPENFATFDGTTFKTYGSSSGYKLTENPGQVIKFVKGDSKGRIWVGSYTPFIDKKFNGSLLYFDDGKFVTFDSLSFPLDNARNFIETPFGDLIFTSDGKNTQNNDGAYIALFKNGAFTKIDESLGVNLINAQILDNYSSYIDSKGNTWIPFWGNLNYVNRGKDKRTGVLMYDGDKFTEYPGLEKYTEQDYSVASVYCDTANDKIYVTLFGFLQKKISKWDNFIFELSNDKWIPSLVQKNLFQTIKNEGIDFKFNFVLFIKGSKHIQFSLMFATYGLTRSSEDLTQLFVENNNLWEKFDAYKGTPVLEYNNGVILTTSRGIGFLTPSNSKLYKQDDGLLFSEATIPGFYADRNGLIWITYSYTALPSYVTILKAGLNVWDGTSLRTLNTDSGLKSNITFTPFQDKKMRVWIPTAKGVTRVREIKNSSGEWILKLKNYELSNNENYNVSTIYETKSGKIFLYQNYVRPHYGTVNKADFFFGKIVGDKVEEIESPFSKELQTNQFQLYSLREDKKGKLWFEGLFGESVEKLSSVKTNIKVFDGTNWNDPPEEWKVPEEQLRFVGELENGAYYLSVGHFYNFNGEKFIDLSDSIDQFADYTILKGASVAGTQTEIQSGNYLYIRLRGRGLVIFDGKNLNFYTPKNSSIPTDIHSPLIDYDGNLFFGSQSGSVKIFKEEVKYYYDDNRISEGGPSVTVLDMNENLIRLYSGVGLLVDKNKEDNSPIKISSVTINNKSYYYKFPSNLSFSENSLLFNYSLLNFSHSDQKSFEHILEGYDKEWSRSSNLSFSEYQNLPSGEFKFKVRATTTNGDKTEVATWAFIINPPWWDTWWAYLFYTITVISILIAIRSYERRRMKLKTAIRIRKEKTEARIKESDLRAEAAELHAKVAETQAKVIQIENDRKSKELEDARQLQLSMLPKDLPNIPNLEIAVYMKTATEVGGDYYDFSIKEDGSLNIAIGDATGHGLKAGILVSMMKSLFTANSNNKEIKDFFETSNRALKKSNLKRMMMGFAMLNIKENKVKLMNAGMPPIYHYKNGLNLLEEISINGVPLGALKITKYELMEISVNKNDVIIMMSDGFPELKTEKEELLDYRRVEEEIKKVVNNNPEEIIEHLKNVGSKWVNDQDPDDDVTFVVIKVK